MLYMPQFVCENIIEITSSIKTKNKRCLPERGYTATAYCRDGIKGTDGSWLKTTTSRVEFSRDKISLGSKWEEKLLTPIYMEGYDTQLWFPHQTPEGGIGYHWPAYEGDNMGDLIINPYIPKKWTKQAIERFIDMYRYTECESYNKNPLAYKFIGIEEIRKLKSKKPWQWEWECKNIEREFLKKINESILKRKNKICGKNKICDKTYPTISKRWHHRLDRYCWRLKPNTLLQNLSYNH